MLNSIHLVPFKKKERYMEISARELNSLDKDEYILVDIRHASEREYGYIAGSIALSEKELLEKPPESGNKKLVIYCERGILSRGAAHELRQRGYDAYSLKEGYVDWLLNEIEIREASEEGICKKAEQSIRKKFRKELMTPFIKALNSYKLVNDKDRICVCISGGKDSMLMAKLFQELKRYSRVDFDVEYVVMDPGYASENRRIIEDNAEILGLPIKVFDSSIFDAVFNVEKNPCYLCARMRRGYLYRYAKELGCNKIALGHHYDDVIETILMGMLYGAQIQTMMPKLHSTNFEGMELIRPLYFVREDDIKAWRDYNGLHFIQCACRFTDTCSTEGKSNSKRLEIKKLIKQLKSSNPDVEKTIFKSVENVHLDTVIAYKKDGVKKHFLDDY